MVLSACQANPGNLSEGDELVGLMRACIFAGTPNVVASLWVIDDEATSLLMEHFYTHLRDGMGKAKALRQAQIEVREEYPNPYYWAGFVLSGDGGEVGEIQTPIIEEAAKIEEAGTTAAPVSPKAPEATPPLPVHVAEEQESQRVEEATPPRSWLSLASGLLAILLLVGGAFLLRQDE